MIFVVIGILILFVSFFVALASLVREQNKLHPEIKDTNLSKSKKTEKILIQPEIIKNQAADPNFVEPPRAILHRDDKDREPYKPLKREPLPWEKVDSVEADEDSDGKNQIEKIQAELTKLQIDQGKENEQNKNDLVDPEMPKQRGLSGEFSLEEFRNKAKNN